MHIAVIGSGYVGLVTGACFAEFGVDVACVDVDADKIAQLNRGQAPIYEPGLEQLIQKNLQAGRLRFTTDLHSAVEPASVVFLAVGTPPKTDGSADLSFVNNAAIDDRQEHSQLQSRRDEIHGSGGNWQATDGTNQRAICRRRYRSASFPIQSSCEKARRLATSCAPIES